MGDAAAVSVCASGRSPVEGMVIAAEQGAWAIVMIVQTAPGFEREIAPLRTPDVDANVDWSDRDLERGVENSGRAKRRA